mmetsp:Transcript_46691/g.92928  ORF Transcript_46691/g.92928 Transcript_46691/m.92928 type:complete len:206 (-) Transcript_46691:243-860(-)|eukprot:CAMPEP_0172719138 /NCGR_PEP_ID=MMETSP1074-20121228/75336_1 /TAXON_ID=2916 /ORGANISM="Ceratium fusus, Strain PA161109" /LENGTH=205 /DNA_ID=CAMNT_0013544463 /DNA_START=16 /DNA_END=633 /DNA_ORIENTATION=-
MTVREGPSKQHALLPRPAGYLKKDSRNIASAFKGWARLTYTEWSLLMAAQIALLQLAAIRWPVQWLLLCRDVAVSMLLANSCAVFVSFHTVPILDPTAWRRLASKQGRPMWMFHVGNFIIHVLPIPVALLDWIILREPTPMGPFTGLATAALQFFWTISRAGGIDLSKVYAYMEEWQWYFLWGVSLTVHLLAGIAMYVISQHVID